MLKKIQRLTRYAENNVFAENSSNVKDTYFGEIIDDVTRMLPLNTMPIWKLARNNYNINVVSDSVTFYFYIN